MVVETRQQYIGYLDLSFAIVPAGFSGDPSSLSYFSINAPDADNPDKVSADNTVRSRIVYDETTDIAFSEFYDWIADEWKIDQANLSNLPPVV